MSPTTRASSTRRPSDGLSIAFRALGNSSAELPTVEGLIEEAHYFNQSVATDAARKGMRRLLGLGGQTREVELDRRGLVNQLAE